MDAGPGHDINRAAVPRPLHAARHVVPAAPDRLHPAGARAPGRGARRRCDRGVARRDLGEGARLAAATGAWICFEDEAGQNLRPPRARTWARRGHTPVVTVSGKGSGRVSVAGLVCLKPGARSHLFYRIRVHRGRKGERRSMSEADYAGLITAAHHQLHAPVILIWDYVARHIIQLCARPCYVASGGWRPVPPVVIGWGVPRPAT